VPKAVITNRIYLDNPGPEITKEITKALTYRIAAKFNPSSKMAAVETIKSYSVLPNGILSIPQARTDLIPKDYEIVDKRVLHEVPFPTPKYALREAQQPVYDEVSDTCFINALVGWGKTFTALHLAGKLGQKTLVITHTTNLRDQWIDEVEALYGMECGVIGSGKYDIEDHAIVICNIQSLVKYIDKVAKEFGTIIVDECHHIPASTFSSALDKLHARYRIGLSGTRIRKDGKHVLFNDYFGHNVVQPPPSDTMVPKVRIIKTGITLDPKATWTEKITKLVQDEAYIQFVSTVAKTQILKGHSVLVIADRVEFLEKIHEQIGEACVLVTGATTKEERDAAKEQLLSGAKRCVAGSRQIFSEGISINILSCVILAIPMSNDSLLEQIVGRVMRQHEGKQNPLVIDMNFAGWSDKKQNNDRLALYLRKGWEVQTV
jgi:superfamily II DNA or RNA helicase